MRPFASPMMMTGRKIPPTIMYSIIAPNRYYSGKLDPASMRDGLAGSGNGFALTATSANDEKACIASFSKAARVKSVFVGTVTFNAGGEFGADFLNGAALSYSTAISGSWVPIQTITGFTRQTAGQIKSFLLISNLLGIRQLKIGWTQGQELAISTQCSESVLTIKIPLISGA